jgi:hypothetical protein
MCTPIFEKKKLSRNSSISEQNTPHIENKKAGNKLDNDMIDHNL